MAKATPFHERFFLIPVRCKKCNEIAAWRTTKHSHDIHAPYWCTTCANEKETV